MPDIHVEADDVIVSGDKVVARMTYSATHSVTSAFLSPEPATGKKFSFGTIDIWRVENGKSVEHWDQVDFAGLQRQLAPKRNAP